MMMPQNAFAMRAGYRLPPPTQLPQQMPQAGAPPLAFDPGQVQPPNGMPNQPMKPGYRLPTQQPQMPSVPWQGGPEMPPQGQMQPSQPNDQHLQMMNVMRQRMMGRM